MSSSAADTTSSGSAGVPCVRIREPGGPEVLVPGTLELPPPARGEVRVRVAVSGVNRADLLQRRGVYPPPPGFPADVPGLEFSGTVSELGPGCRLRAGGDRVMGIVGGGGYAREVVGDERETLRVPEGLTTEEGGAVPEVFLTAWDALFGQAGLRAGEVVLIHAVGSGVGTAALQLARRAGARTVGTSRTPEKVERALAMGLDDGVVAGEDWPARVHDALGEGGADVILDLVGGAYLEGNLEVLGERARWVVVGVPGGSTGPLDLRRLMSRRALIRGTVLRPRPREEKARLAREFERLVVPGFETGSLRPVVDSVLAARDAPEAHRRIEANETFGKMLLSW
jgi:NADPH:quinone reductase